MKIKFWGVRGSIPCPGPSTQKFGGNGACLELRVGAKNRIVVIDAGSGIRELGNHLMKNDLPNGPIAADLFLSHTHWDHIMGFPYFTPIYVPGSKLKVYGPVSFEDDPLEEVVGGQMKYRYFPVNFGELASDIEYIRLKEEPLIDLGDGLQLTTKILNHPITTLGYRFTYEGKVFCTCYDTEPYRNLFITDTDHPEYDEAMAIEGEEVAREQNLAMEEFFGELTFSCTMPSTPVRNIRRCALAGDIRQSSMPLKPQSGQVSSVLCSSIMTLTGQTARLNR